MIWEQSPIDMSVLYQLYRRFGFIWSYLRGSRLEFVADCCCDVVVTELAGVDLLHSSADGDVCHRSFA